jgi:ABC-type uncharacterized transport system permease subunit
MKIVKGLLVVLASYAVLALTKIYPVLFLSNSGLPGSASLFGPAFFPGNAVLLIPFIVIPGLVFWLGRTLIANQLALRVFKANPHLSGLLEDFGVAHFPLIFVGISSMIIFVFGLSNIGIFASLFLGMFFSLLMYAYFVAAVMENSKLNWKKALLVIAITEAVVAACLFFAGLITLHPFMQNSLMNIMTV